jgi:hypothetical protein
LAWRSWLPAPGTEQEPREQERNLPFPPTIGCLLSIGIGLLGVGVFYLLVTIAVQGEIRVRRGEFGETRVWLIREAGEQGLGFSRARVVSGNEAAGAVCVETRVSFLMLRAAEGSQPVSYCECLEKIGETWTSTSECPAQSSVAD